MPRGWTEQAPVPEQEPVARERRGTISTEKPPERAVLAARIPRQDIRWELPAPLGELGALARTAGVEVVGEPVVQRRDKPDSATCLGKGTVERLGEMIAEHGASCVLFDNDLTPAQRRNLEKRLGKKVVDRTELILDIFALHARSPQARRQVEVAQLQYALPRLRRMWTHLDVGVGLRNPGEKQIELDKRLIRERINELKRELAKARVRKEREVRSRSEVFRVALVGYTNAGKSTLMNRLTEAEVFAADQLFATLDTRTRVWTVGPNRRVLLSDTVGFIRQLPHHLVESFHATLEEVVHADLLLHVVDASDPKPLAQVQAVREVLQALGVDQVPELMALNKIDQVAPELLPFLERRLGNTVRISAKTGEGVEALRRRVNELAAAQDLELELRLDVREGKALALVESEAEVQAKHLDDETMVYRLRCHPRVLGALRAALRDPEAMVARELPRPPAEEQAPAGEAVADPPPAQEAAAS